MTIAPTAPAVPKASAHAPTFRWLFPTGLFTLLAIGVLWAIRPNDCVEYFPNGCQPIATDSPAIVAGGILIALFAAIVTVALTVRERPHRTVVLWVLTGALALVFLMGLLVSVSTANAPVPYPCETCGVIVD